LAGQGLAVPFGDGLDLIHDFFLEGWPAVERGYDPGVGPLRPYAYRAFWRFARARIIRMNRLAHGSLDQTPEARFAQPADEASDARLNRDALSQALADIRPEDRDLLEEYFTIGDSERALARRLGMTRYRMRMKLVEALW